jgi:hypothetical protein
VLNRRHRLDRRQREAVLALAWLAAMHANPTYVRRAELVGRHDRLAADLGDEADGEALRGVTDRWLETELGAVARAAAG